MNVMLCLKRLLIVFCLLVRISSGEEKCGGEVVHEENDSIHFRGTEGLETNECIWIIYTSEQSKVTAKIEACTLTVKTDGSYEMSYIEVRDGEHADDPLIGNYTHWDCLLSESSISIGYASTNAMWIRLVSPTITDDDIYFDLKFDACGGNIKTKGGSVSSPFYPDSYLKGGNCTWTVNTYQGTVFSSNFDAFKLRYSEDSIEIGNDGGNGEADIGRYTNDDHPWTVNNTESNIMWITLTAFEFAGQNGAGPFIFQLKLKVIGGNGGDIFGQKGFIVSPGNPKGSENGIYPNVDATYIWNIYCPNGTFVLGYFVDFSLYTFDKVRIFDGDESEYLIEYLGNQGRDEQFNTTGNKMVVKLHTFWDENTDIGFGRFELHFEGLLLSTSEEVTGYNGTVYSPLYPLPYPMNVQYTTKISTPSGSIMKIEFKELTLRNGDNVSVYDQDGRLLVGYTPGENVEVLESHTNITFVILYSGSEDNARIGNYSLEFEAIFVCFIPDGEINGELYPEDDIYWPGDELMITCHEGYESSTNYTNVTCETDGSWSDDFPTCIAVVCGDPGKVENGESEGDDFTYGSNVTYRCQEGYTLNGTSTITCLSNGTWSDDLPHCIIVSCENPGPLKNGEETGDTFTYGSNITYNCNEGYHLNGSESIICQSDGTWNEEMPVCLLIDCDEPDDVENSEKHGNSYLYDDVVFYKCNEGYHFESNVSYIVCQENGKWSELPACVPIGANDFFAILVIILLILVIVLIVLAVLCRRWCQSKPKAKQEQDYHHDLDTIQRNGFEAALASDAVDYRAISMNDKENGNLYSPQDNLTTTFTSNTNDSQPVGGAASVSNLNTDNSGRNANSLQNDSRFVVNDIYEGCDNKITASNRSLIQDADATNILAKVPASTTHISDIHSTAVGHNTGFKENVIYEGSGARNSAAKNINSYEDLDEKNPLIATRTDDTAVHGTGNEYTAVISKKGITKATSDPEYDCIAPRGDNSHHGSTNATVGHVDNVIYQSGDVELTQTDAKFTDNILYSSSSADMENTTNTAVQGAGFVDNMIYEHGNVTKGEPDSKFTDNVLYEPTRNVDQDGGGDAVSRNGVHYYTLEEPEPEVPIVVNPYESVDTEKRLNRP